MLVLVIESMRRECLNNPGNFERSSAIKAMSAASMAIAKVLDNTNLEEACRKADEAKHKQAGTSSYQI